MQVGSLAPGFDLPTVTVPGRPPGRACLADSRGRWLALVFYPRDFSLVCPTELTGLGARIEDFRARGCDLLGISCDTVETHDRWLATPRARGGVANLGFPLASDADGSLARSYNVLVDHQHVALRGLFLIDPNGVLQYAVVHNLSVGRGADEVLRVLAALQTGGLCPSDWGAGDPNLDPAEILGPGSMISHYRIEGEIGSGSFATVFRAVDLTLERSVALKVLKSSVRVSPTTVLAEARSTAALSHPNVCTIYAVDDSEGVPFIAMELLQGRPLSRHLESGPLRPERAADIARQSALGLAAAHAAGIIHGDLKPDNVMVDEDGRVRLLDFGLARRDSRTELDPYAETAALGVAETAGIYGTPGYMAPEQARGHRATPASDIFTFGAVLYEMLTGERAFPGENVLHVLDQIRNVDPDRLAARLPEPFADILRCCMTQDPAARTIPMREIAARLS